MTTSFNWSKQKLGYFHISENPVNPTTRLFIMGPTITSESPNIIFLITDSDPVYHIVVRSERLEQAGVQ